MFDAALQVHTAVVYAWSCIPSTAVVPRLASDLIAMVDGFGSLGTRAVRARLARARSNRWAAALINDVRAGNLAPVAGTALAVVTGHRDRSGRALPTEVAGVELLNILRPTAAGRLLRRVHRDLAARHPPTCATGWLAATGAHLRRSRTKYGADIPSCRCLQRAPSATTHRAKNRSFVANACCSMSTAHLTRVIAVRASGSPSN